MTNLETKRAELDRERADLDRSILEWIRGGVFQDRDDTRFAEASLRLFAFQYANNPAYQRICRVLGIAPRPDMHWHEIPLVPTTAFKQTRLACFEEAATRKVFRTSGTTSGARGELHLDTLELYEASLRATFRAFVLPDLAAGDAIDFEILAADPVLAEDSSLSHMFGVAVSEFGTTRSRFHLSPSPVGPGAGWNVAGFALQLEDRSEPVVLAGTAFAFVHLLDHLAEQAHSLNLPEGSRIMETGGFKGRSREIDRESLHANLSKRLGVPRERIINQYGMSELATQFYEPSLVEGRESEAKWIPPWVRIRALSPETLEDVAQGDVGVLAIYDLANTGSVQGILTADAGCLVEDRVIVHGRLPGTEPRGCSLAAEETLDW